MCLFQAYFVKKLLKLSICQKIAAQLQKNCETSPDKLTDC